MLHIESRPTKPAAAAAVTLPKKSWIIGAACSRMPMPAVTLQNRTVHSSQNCGVLIAFVAVKLPPVGIDRAPCALNVHPPGHQPSAGNFTALAPSTLEMKDTNPRKKNDPTSPSPRLS